MPRRPPKAVRAGLRRRCRWPTPAASIKGLSRHAVGDIDRLERTRGYLRWGRTEDALGKWRWFVRHPYRRLWVDIGAGCGFWECCGDPREAREFLEGVMLSLPKRSARELRRIVSELDDMY